MHSSSSPAAQSAERVGDPELLAQAVAAHAVAIIFNGKGIELEAIHRGIEFGDAAPHPTMNLPSATLGQILFWSDNHKAARPVYERLLRRTRERGELHDTARWCSSSQLEWRAGNRDTAEDHRTTAKDLVRDQHDFDIWMMRGESRSRHGCASSITLARLPYKRRKLPSGSAIR